MNTIRELILKRINEIKDHEHGFKKGTMKWDNFFTGTEKRHVSEVNFEEFDDFELVYLFERVVRRYNTQM